MAMLEPLAHLLLLPGDLAGRGWLGRAGSAARRLGDLGPQFLAGGGPGVRHCLENFLEDVERTDLMRHVGPQLLERLGVQLRAIRGDAPDCQAARGPAGP